MKWVWLVVSAGFFWTPFAWEAQAQTPHWIWHNNPELSPQGQEIRFFRKTFLAPEQITKAILTAAGDDEVTIFLNGTQVAANRSWSRAVSVNLTKQIKAGENTLMARGRNSSGDAAIIAKLEMTSQDGQKQLIVTDTSWLSTAAEQPVGWLAPQTSGSGWTKAVSRGLLGVQPWGDVLAAPVATRAENLTLLPGFKAELIRSAEPGEGSWICLAIDPKGRLIISPQEPKANLLRATLSPSGQIAKIEAIDLPVASAMGLLYAFDSLYVSGAGPNGLGLYRLRDTNKDDQFDAVDFLKKFDGAAGEHGSHALVLGPDQMIYYLHGNFVKLPPDLSAESPHRNYQEDQLLPRADDGNGFGSGIQPPGGFLLRTDRDGKKWELVAGGMRNAYDFDFNADGEMFTFDSDMEWDWGMPWYRPIRILHLVSAGDYGFREGTGKWPAYYPDCLPATVDIGIGSPTGVKFGTQSKFPSKYQKALYAMDWSYGRIVAVHLQAEGASYKGTFETFLKGKPLNVTDLEFGQDGAMYFLTGGRGTQSGLYRVRYEGGSKTAAEDQPHQDETGNAAARAVRRRLETFHGKKDPGAVEFAWRYLDSNDRWVRYAARCAIESQEINLWKERALSETRLNASLSALLALARRGSPDTQGELLNALGRLPDELSEEKKLEALRVVGLAFIRMGKPDAELAQDVIGVLDPLYPSSNPALNRELSQSLIYLQAPGVVEKSLGLVEAAPTLEEQIHYIFHLRTVKTGWTAAQRRRYFSWFNQNHGRSSHSAGLLKWFEEAGREYGHGASFPKFLANFRKQALMTLTPEEQGDLADIIAGVPVAARPAPAQRSFVKDWQLGDLLPAISGPNGRRSFANGQKVFAEAQCLACHRFGSEGGSVGPDITAISSRFTRRDLLESLIDPSKVISDQYQNTWILRKDATDLTGRVVEETVDAVVVRTNPYTEEKTIIPKREIERRQASKISPMPEGLLNVFNREEILDLMSYVETGGKKEHSVFQ